MAYVPRVYCSCKPVLWGLCYNDVVVLNNEKADMRYVAQLDCPTPVIHFPLFAIAASYVKMDYAPIVLTRGRLCGYYATGLVALNSNLCSEFLLYRAAVPKDSTAVTIIVLACLSIVLGVFSARAASIPIRMKIFQGILFNGPTVITSSASHLHAPVVAMLIFAQVKCLTDQLQMLVSEYKHNVAHSQASAWCAASFPWMEVANVIPDKASLGTGCSLLNTLIAIVLSILCFDPGIGCYNCYGWHKYKMLVFARGV